MESMSRRGVLRGLATVGTAVGIGGAAGCTPTKRTQSTSPPADLPTYKAYRAIEPDLEGNGDGLPDAYLQYPSDPTILHPDPIGAGEQITAMIGISGAVPPAKSSNTWWQGLDQRLGIDLNVALSPTREYGAKLTTALAGSDLPDLVQLRAIQRLPEALDANFENLSEYLAGDAALDYPALANLPTLSWKTCTFDGQIFAVPPQNLVASASWLLRQDLVAQVGANNSPANDEEFYELCVRLAGRSAHSYALAAPLDFLRYFATAMYAAPNGWQVSSSGEFVHEYETDAYLQALEFTRRLWSDKLFHPDSFGNANAVELFGSGVIGIRLGGGLSYQRAVVDTGINEDDLGFVVPPSAFGSATGAPRLGPGTYHLSAIRKQDSPERVKLLLRVLDYLASPFGSAEYLYRMYGEEGVHYSWDQASSAPVVLDRTELFSVHYLAGPPYVLFDPGHDDLTRRMYSYQKVQLENGIHDATTGLYSETDDREGPALLTELNDLRGEIIQGRTSIDEWPTAVTRWRDGGGETIRSEYQNSHAEQT